MIIKELKIREHNKQVYLEILKDMIKKKNGLFTFTLRVSDGDIVDYVSLENLGPGEVLLDDELRPESA